MNRLPNLVATTAVNFFKQRFRDQNWIDTRTEPWKPRKGSGWGNKKASRTYEFGSRKYQQAGRGGRNRRAVLIQTGRLRRSLRKISATMDQVVIGTDVPYAQAHNDGFRGKVTQHVKAHMRNRTKLGIISAKQGKRSSRVKFGRVVTGNGMVRAHTRTIHQNLPRRRFMGQSAALNRIMERQITAEFIRSLK